MTAAATVPTPPAQQPSGGVTIFGRRISYDALLIAGASLLGILWLWNLNQSANSGSLYSGDTTANPSLPTDASGASFQLVEPPIGNTTTGPGWIPDPTTSSYFNSAPTQTQQAAPAAQPSQQFTGTQAFGTGGGVIGTGGGSNTTGRSSGTQVGPSDYSTGGGFTSSAGPEPQATPGPAPTYGMSSGSGVPATVIPNTPPPVQNAQGKNRNSGGQIVQ